jgi:hypothetical protein
MWKRAKDINEANKKAAEARKQTSEYAGGVPGDMELKDTRYIVIVSEHQLPRMQNLEADGVRFRHINIAVDPLTPSKAAGVRET